MKRAEWLPTPQFRHSATPMTGPLKLTHRHIVACNLHRSANDVGVTMKLPGFSLFFFVFPPHDAQKDFRQVKTYWLLTSEIPAHTQ